MFPLVIYCKMSFQNLKYDLNQTKENMYVVFFVKKQRKMFIKSLTYFYKNVFS